MMKMLWLNITYASFMSYLFLFENQLSPIITSYFSDVLGWSHMIWFLSFSFKFVMISTLFSCEKCIIMYYFNPKLDYFFLVYSKTVASLMPLGFSIAYTVITNGNLEMLSSCCWNKENQSHKIKDVLHQLYFVV